MKYKDLISHNQCLQRDSQLCSYENTYKIADKQPVASIKVDFDSRLNLLDPTYLFIFDMPMYERTLVKMNTGWIDKKTQYCKKMLDIKFCLVGKKLTLNPIVCDLKNPDAISIYLISVFG